MSPLQALEIIILLHDLLHMVSNLQIRFYQTYKASLEELHSQYMWTDRAMAIFPRKFVSRGIKQVKLFSSAKFYTLIFYVLCQISFNEDFT